MECIEPTRGVLVLNRATNRHETDGMVSLRIWVEPKRIFTLRQRKTMVANEIAVSLNKGQGPRDTNDFLVKLIRLILDHMEDSVEQLDESVDALEERALVAQEELIVHLAERTNHTIYRISILSTIFLPLGLVTGLLGINVGGICPARTIPPLSGGGLFFLVGITLLVIALLKRSRWL